MEYWLVALSIVATAVTILMGSRQFSTALQVNIDQFNKAAIREGKRPFLEKRLEHFTEIMNIIGILNSTEDSKIFEQASFDFWRLYWGALILYEDESVEVEMKGLGDILKASEGNLQTFDRDRFTDRIFKLKASLRQSIQSEWEIINT